MRSILPPPLPFFKTDTPAATLGFVRLVRGFLDLSSRLWVIIRFSNTLVIHEIDLAVKIVLEHTLRPGGGQGCLNKFWGLGGSFFFSLFCQKKPFEHLDNAV